MESDPWEEAVEDQDGGALATVAIDRIRSSRLRKTGLFLAAATSMIERWSLCVVKMKVFL